MRLLAVLFLAVQCAWCASIKEGECTYIRHKEWGPTCTVVFVSVRDVKANETVANGATLTRTAADTRTADKKMVKKSVMTMVKQYLDNTVLHDLMNMVQDNNQCCGVEGFMDWDMNEHFSCNATGSNDKCGVPYTCCKEQSPLCGKMARDTVRHPDPTEILHTRGCLQPIMQRSKCFKKESDGEEKPQEKFDPSTQGPFTCYYDGDASPVMQAFLSGSTLLTAPLPLLLATALFALL